MSARISVWLAVGGFAVALTAAPAAAQTAKPDQPVKPEWAAAHDLKVRKGKDTDWDKALKVGVEVFKDAAGGAVLAINAAGNIAVALDDAAPGKKADWVTGLNFSVRGPTEQAFTAQTTLFGVELFRGVLPGYTLFVSERGGMAFYKAEIPTGAGKDPLFQYGLSLKARKPDQERFGPESKAYGMEAYKDNNTGGLVYITEAGMLTTAAAVPEKAPSQNEIKKPKPLYQLLPRVRKAGEADFTDKTQKLNVEVFRDEHTGTLIYISETGAIAAVPPPAEVKKDQKLTWSHAMELKARSGGEADFAKAKKYGIEVFTDNHTGYTLYVTETGAIGVVAAKK